MTQRNGSLRAVLHAALAGDALGAPFNGLKHGHIQQLAGSRVEGFLVQPILQPDRPERNRLTGLHSSVGQRILAGFAMAGEDSLGREPVARVGARLLELAGEGEDQGYRLGALREPGRPLRRAIARWREEYPWEARDYFTSDEESEGIAPAVMGIVAYALAPGEVPRVALELARLTHYRSMAVMSAVAVARFLERIAAEGNPRRFDVQSVIHDVLEGLRADEDAYAEEHLKTWRELGWGRPPSRLSAALGPLPSLLREQNDDLAVRTIVATASGSFPKHPVTHPQHGFAAAGLSWALYRALGDMPPVRALEDIINRGGETSAVAALTAAFAVRRHGEEALPEEWYAKVLARDMIDELFPSPNEEAFVQWVRAEHGWTAKEEEMREPLREAARRHKALEEERARRRPAKPGLPPQEEAPFAPPPHLWLKPGEEEDPKKKKILKEQRARRRIDWKEERRRKEK